MFRKRKIFSIIYKNKKDNRSYICIASNREYLQLIDVNYENLYTLSRKEVRKDFKKIVNYM